jgi:hypothetical protein
MSLMLLRSISLLCAFTFMACSALAFQSAGNKALQRELAGLQAVATSNHAMLQNYQWTETTIVLVAGEANAEQRLCRYGQSGKVRKTLVIDPGDVSQQQLHGGLRSRAVQKKTAETRDYVARLNALIGDYLPLNPEKMQGSIQAGNASLAPGTGDLSTITISNYLKPGDKLAFLLDSAGGKIRSVTIDTYLDDPTSNPITLTATFASLPDGTSYVADTDLKASDGTMEIKTVSSNYEKIFR